MTALVMKGDRERCMAAGMDGYLSKPIRPQELDEVLDSYLARGSEGFSVAEPNDSLEASVSAKELLERIDGDRSLLAELVELFRGDYPGQIRTAREAVAKGDAGTLQRVGHALKGTTGNLAAPIASRIADELESMGRTGDLALAGTRVTALEEELIRVVEVLEGLCMEVLK
jgi:HPt (histidine-containing phosphotransfer) domain-containing protein